MEFISKLLIIFGTVLVLGGVGIHFGLPLGRLPGDITINKGNIVFYFPITTSIIISIAVMILFLLINYLEKIL